MCVLACSLVCRYNHKCMAVLTAMLVIPIFAYYYCLGKNWGIKLGFYECLLVPVSSAFCV